MLIIYPTNDEQIQMPTDFHMNNTIQEIPILTYDLFSFTTKIFQLNHFFFFLTIIVDFCRGSIFVRRRSFICEMRVGHDRVR